VRRRLVRRTPSRADRRRVQVTLTRRGETLIRQLSAAHLVEFQQIGPELRRLIDAMVDR